MYYMEYMTKVRCWIIVIDGSYHIGPIRTPNCFDLHYLEETLIYKLNILNKVDDQTYFSIQ
jgi:hypothetical protein